MIRQGNTMRRLGAIGTIAALALTASACGGSTDDKKDASGDSTETTAAGDASSDTTTASGDAESTDSDSVTATQEGGSILDAVLSRGNLNCGVSGSAVAFSSTQSDGSVTGIDADYCRAVAAAVTGSGDNVTFSSLTAAERFTAVQTGNVDVLMRNSTFTQSRDTEVGMDFGPTTYYDGQQLMGRASAGFSAESTIKDIEGATVCTNAGTTTETNITELTNQMGVTITLQTFEDYDQVTDAYIQGTCDVMTTDGSALVGRKALQQPEGEEWVIFPSTPISKEPLGPVYGQNDSKWADVVNWTVYATIIADEYGVTSADVDKAKAGEFGPEMARLMGGEGELQTKMGLPADAFYNVIKEVGNYGEIYERNLVPVGLVREGSANALYKDGGLLYAPPAR